MVGITGRIQTRSYENQQGQRVYVTEVVAENFQMLESRAAREGGNANVGYNQPQQQAPNFARENTQYHNSNPIDISSDDLPF